MTADEVAEIWGVTNRTCDGNHPSLGCDWEKCLKIAAQSVVQPAFDHVNDWVDARNAVVKSGEICLECGAIRSGIRRLEISFSDGR